MPRIATLFATILAVTGGLSPLMTPAAFAQTAATADTLTIGSPAPKLPVAEWVKGAPVTLGDGKIHVVEFWATWCGPCKESIPHLTALAKKYAGKADFTGVSVFERGANVPTLVKNFVTSMGTKMDYHVARDDAQGTIARTWMEASGQGGIPTAFVVDKAGKIAWIGHPMDGLDETVQKVIAGTYDSSIVAKQLKAQQEEQAKQQEKNAKLDELFGPALKLASEKKFAEAVALIDKTLETNPQYTGDVALVKARLLMSYDETAGQAYVAKASAAELKENPQVLNQIAWAIVAPDSKLKKPDYAAAVVIAEAAVAATKEKEAAILDTLSYAYERAGDLDKAIAAEEKAVALYPMASRSEDVVSFKERVATLKKLKAGK